MEIKKEDKIEKKIEIKKEIKKVEPEVFVKGLLGVNVTWKNEQELLSFDICDHLDQETVFIMMSSGNTSPKHYKEIFAKNVLRRIKKKGQN